MNTSLGELGLNPEKGFNLKHGTFITSLDVNNNNTSPRKMMGRNTSEVKTSTKVIENLYSQIDQLTNNTFHLTNQNQELLKQINMLNDQISRLNRTNDMSRNEISTKDLKIKKLQKQTAAHEQQLEKFEKDYEFLRIEFLEKARSYHQDNMTLEEEVEELKISLDELIHDDPLNRCVKEYDEKFYNMDSSFKDLKLKLIEEMDGLKEENSVNIDKLNDLYTDANNLLSEFENNNETKRQYLKETVPKLDKEIRSVSDRQQYLNNTLSQLERGSSSNNTARNQRPNNRNKRSSMYENNSNGFQNNKSTSNSPYLNSRRNSRFYGNHLDKPNYESQSNGNSPKLNGNSLSNKRQSFLLDDQQQSNLGLGIQTRRTGSKLVQQPSSNNIASSLPGLKRGGSIRR